MVVHFLCINFFFMFFLWPISLKKRTELYFLYNISTSAVPVEEWSTWHSIKQIFALYHRKYRSVIFMLYWVFCVCPPPPLASTQTIFLYYLYLLYYYHWALLSCSCSHMRVIDCIFVLKRGYGNRQIWHSFNKLEIYFHVDLTINMVCV